MITANRTGSRTALTLRSGPAGSEAVPLPCDSPWWYRFIGKMGVPAYHKLRIDNLPICHTNNEVKVHLFDAIIGYDCYFHDLL